MYRMVDCGTWHDGWFSELPPDGKLLFLNLLTNSRSTPAGAFEVTVRTMAFETGLTTERVAELLTSFGDRVVYWPEHHIVWLRNFFRRQKPNDKFTISARRIIAALPPAVRERVCQEYPHLSPSFDTHPEEDDTRSEADDTHGIPTPVAMDAHPLVLEPELERALVVGKEPELGESLREDPADEALAADAAGPGSDPTMATPKPTKDPPGFREFWAAYPKKEGRIKAVEQWKRLRPPPEQRQAMLDALALHKLSEKWRRGFVMEAARWLRERRWEDEIEAETALNGTGLMGSTLTAGSDTDYYRELSAASAAMHREAAQKRRAS